MRQVFLEKGTLAIKEVCEPVLNDHSVLVSVSYSFISVGAGLTKIINADQDKFYRNVPHKIKKVIELVKNRGFDYTAMIVKDKLGSRVTTLGYSCSGTVIAAGKKVKKFRVGDFVACVGPGVANHADVVSVPESLVVRVKNSDLLKEASLTGVGAIALQAIRRADLSLGETVTVFGLETLGQMIAQLAHISGCKVIGIDSDKSKLDIAEKMGIEVVHNNADSLDEIVRLNTDGHGVDCSIITPDCFEEGQFVSALNVTRKSGRVVITGNADTYINKDLAYQKEIDLCFSLSYGPGRFDEEYEYKGRDYPYPYVRWTENRNMQLFINMVEEKKLNLDNFVKSEFPLTDLNKAADKVRTDDCLGVVLDYNSSKEFKNLAVKKSPRIKMDGDKKFIPAYKDNLNVCILGVNKNTRLKLMPTISSIENVNINTVVDRNMTDSSNAAKWHGALAMSGGAGVLFEEKSDIVVVGQTGEITVNDVSDLLKQDKAVLTTRPIVFNYDDLEVMKSIFIEKPDACFSTGYYRSYSPFMQKIKGDLLKRRSPLMINFRMNAGYIPKDQRMSSQWKAGRVIAQASHVFDLFCYLTDSKPTSISVESLRSWGDSFLSDNFSTNITFEDGSICSLIFTSLGSPDLGKERMELFFDSKSIVMDDYIKLVGYGLPTSFEEKCKVPDLGYSKFMRSFFECARSRNNDLLPISYDRLLAVAKINLTVDELICAGGGEK
jgi:threonine dehydrogenase-like Zn-dependent dehydrogenase/predicted dehydrogenase